MAPPLSILSAGAASLDSQATRYEGVAALIQDWTRSFDDFRAEIDELIDRGEWVVVPLVLRGRVHGSEEEEEEVTLPETHAWRVREA